MELRIGYEEAAGLIAKAVNYEVALKRVADDEIGVAAKVKVMFVSKWVNVNLKVEQFMVLMSFAHIPVALELVPY